ncbi:hypothetical protein IWW39_000463 [Coemansia spiralis]|uniref:NADH:flavin oxidoreductase/NADH oxidase N-terminal domain-containing protein n=1 Tax=Coemansia spiralis TaxID=417178 RepID=A0A9W8GS46_9FUNG|nr:hypothetical protein IWW39_000463 [Coemansia spiralis]
MSPTITKSHEYYQDQANPSPGIAIEPSASAIAQSFAQGPNPSPLPKAFQPLTIRGSTIKNRIWVSPMCMYSSEDGFATDFHLSHYSQYAMHGAGLVMVEATGVLPEGRLTPNCLGIWKDEHIGNLSRIVNHAHKYGAVMGIQLGHSGRKGSTLPLHLYGTRPTLHVAESEGGWPNNVYGPSPIAYDDQHYTPREMTIADINAAQQAFADAAVRADQAGFDVIELHGAHGYLLFEFLSPLSNQRTDKYGGSFDNRVRFLVETIRKVRQVWPQEKPLFVRVSATDWVEGGWTGEDTVALAKIMSVEGVDLIDCSTAGNDPRQNIPAAPGFQVPFATAVKKQVPGILTGTVGVITKPSQVNEITEEGKADVVFLAREFLRNPSFVLSAAHELGVYVKWANQYERGQLKTKHSYA